MRQLRSRPLPLDVQPEAPRFASSPWDVPPPPIADHARVADRAQPCAACGHAILPGQRMAELAADGGAIHVSCASSAAAAGAAR